MAPLDAAALAAVEAAFEATRDAETRLRYQMVLLAHRGMAAPEVGRLTRGSARTVAAVVRRYWAGGVAAVPRRRSPGVPPTVTEAWRAELLRVIELSPRAVGVDRAVWTTGLLAEYLAGATGVAVSPETVRRHLHAAGYVCKRPTWTLKRKAEEQAEYPGNAPGWRRC
ncbi:MAG TPA: helix-turn-helix domain-containing protein [Chloroflexota bacterium]|nr:helix-turn-helix domain-containing protein [Chloroflexota bacterium]